MKRAVTVAGACVDALRVLARAEPLGEGPYTMARGLALAVLDAVQDVVPPTTAVQAGLVAETLLAESQRPEPPLDQASHVDVPEFAAISRTLSLGLRADALKQALHHLAVTPRPRGEGAAFAAALLEQDAVGLANAAGLIATLPELLNYVASGATVEGKDDAILTLTRLAGGIVPKEAVLARASLLATAAGHEFEAMITKMVAPANSNVVSDVRSAGAAGGRF